MSGKGGARTPVSGPRQSGTVIDWKGAFGWIQPSKPIKHPSAQKRGGKVFLGAEDVVEELDGIGCTVNFQVYADSSGLGAADVRMGSGKAVAQSGPKANGKPAYPATSNAVAAFKAANKPGAKATGKGVAAKSPHQTAFQKKGSAPQGQAGGKGGKGDNGGKGGKWGNAGKGGKGGKGNKPGGGWQDREGKREMVHDEPLLGTIVDWKGKWGWLKPHDTIDHPLAKKHHGDLYLKQEDVETEIEGVGAVVQFMLYEDKQGLGAANVMAVE